MPPTAYVMRELKVRGLLEKRSVLLLGPRRTGKSSLIRHELNPNRIFNLLESDTFQRLSARPSLVRESLQPTDTLVVIDEIQKLPLLMDEVHSLIESSSVHFLLTGSSARKLTGSYTKLMGGRARSVTLHPLSFCELKPFSLVRAVTIGTMPFIYLSDEPWTEIRGYVSDYVREEVVAEGLTRKVDQFSRFLEVAALTHAQELNYEAIGRDAQVAARTVRDYFSVLSDTLFGETLVPFTGRSTRKASAHGKFYFFDIAVPHGLLKVKDLTPGTPQFATSFEHLVFRELRTFRDYRSPDLELHFYRDVSKREIDFLLNDEVGIEVKSSTLVHDGELKHLVAVGGELGLKRMIVVSREPIARRVGRVEILPIEEFLTQLWAGQIIG
jgi:uncharacterized protein